MKMKVQEKSVEWGMDRYKTGKTIQKYATALPNGIINDTGSILPTSLYRILCYHETLQPFFAILFYPPPPPRIVYLAFLCCIGNFSVDPLCQRFIDLGGDRDECIIIRFPLACSPIAEVNSFMRRNSGEKCKLHFTNRPIQNSSPDRFSLRMRHFHWVLQFSMIHQV